MRRGYKNGDNMGSCINPRARLINQFGAEREIVALRRRKTAGHWRKENIRAKLDDGSTDVQFWHYLIDHRNDNKRILKRPLTRLQAFKRNKMLEGSGKAWSMCND